MRLTEKIEIIAANKLPDTDGVVAAYLFGSVLEESGRAPKDIDLAFLLDEGRYKEDPLKAQAGAQLFAAGLSASFDMKTDVTWLILKSTWRRLKNLQLAGLSPFGRNTCDDCFTARGAENAEGHRAGF